MIITNEVSEGARKGLYHVPVLLTEAIALLNLSTGKTIVDCTLGGGGHSREIIKTILPDGILISIDQDTEAIEAFRDFAGRRSSNIKLVNGNFADLDEILSSCGTKEVDGVLFDLGVSSYQLKGKERGFSFQVDGPLDMRMNRDLPLTAADVVNDFPQEELARIIYHYGDEPRSRKIAKEIVKEREIEPVLTTGRLAAIIIRVMGFPKRNMINPATKTFMALRIFLNKELEALEQGLRKALRALKRGGRMVVISFHSLEDRIVKRFFKEASRRCRCPVEIPVCRCEGYPIVKLINKKPVLPSEEEVFLNPRARSAKLRAIEKINQYC